MLTEPREVLVPSVTSQRWPLLYILRHLLIGNIAEYERESPLLNDQRSQGLSALTKGLRRYFSTSASSFSDLIAGSTLHPQHCLLQSSLRDTQPDRTNWLEAPTDFLRPSAGTIRHCWVNSRESSSRLHDLKVLLASSARNDCRLLCSHSKDTRGELYKQRKRDHMGHFSCFSPLTANYMTFLLQRQCTFFLLFFSPCRIPPC